MGFLDLFRTDPVTKMHQLSASGTRFLEKGENAQAFHILNEALQFSREVGDCVQEAKILNALGAAQFRLGNPQVAIGYFMQSLGILREKLKVGESFSSPEVVYEGRGASHTFVVQRSTEEDYLTRIQTNTGKQKRIDMYAGFCGLEAKSLIWLGIANTTLKNTEKGLSYAEEALRIARERGDENLESTCLAMIEQTKSAIQQSQ
jgi:tetratricopeptide (TPR) repeat protein